MIKRNIKKIFIILFLLSSITGIQAQSSLQNKFRLAQSFEKSGEFEKAKEIYAELTELQPGNEIYVRALNSLYLQLKEYPKSIELLSSAIDLSPANIDFYGMLGATHYIEGEDAQAFEIWDDAIKEFPDQNFRFRTIANYAVENRALDKAIEILLKGKEESDDPVQYSYDLANLYSGTMKFEKAAREYAFALERQPKQMMMIRARIQNYIFSRDAYEPTIRILEKKYDENGKTAFLEVLSFFYRQMGDFERAFERVKELDKKTGNNGSKIFSFAQDAYREGNFDAASKAYLQLLNNYKNSALVTSAKLGYALSEESRLQKAEKENRPEWKTYFKTDTSYAPEYRKVLHIYNQLSLLKAEPELSREAKFRMGKIYKNNLADFDSAKISFTSLLNDAPVSDLAQRSALELGKIYIQKGDLEKAETELKKVLASKRNPIDLKNEAAFLLGKINYWKYDFNEANIFLSEAAQNLEDDFSNDAIELAMIINMFKNDSLSLAEFADADFLTARGKFSEAREAFRLIAMDNSLFLLNDLAKFRFAETAAAEDDLPTAAKILGEITDSEKENFYSDKSLYLLAEIYYFGFKDEDAALDYYNKLLERFPNSLYLEKSREKINKIITKKNNSI